MDQVTDRFTVKDLREARGVAADVRARGEERKAEALDRLISLAEDALQVKVGKTSGAPPVDRLAIPPTLNTLRARRDEILRIAAAAGAHNVRVFGSVVRGDATPESDIDFLVDLDPGRTLFDLSGLILDLEDALGRKVDVIEIQQPSRVGDKILRQAIPL